MASPLLYLQLWSLRHETATGPAGTVRRVREWGYDGVELAGDYGWSADRWRGILGETGLTVISAHTGLGALETDLAKTLDFHRALGCHRLAVSSLPREMQTTDGYHDAARRLNAVGQRLAAEGFALGYHNHDFEFTPLDGACGMDILLAETDPALVRFEFDTYWLEYAGHTAWQLIRRHRARVFAIHAKDLRKSDRADVPAGQGDVDFRGLLPLATAHGWPVIVEYEGADASDAVRQAAEFLRPLLG